MISEQKDIVHIKYTDILFTKNIKTRQLLYHVPRGITGTQQKQKNL